ncbi:MAG TPA: pyridoxal phosphate-dependent aminotransferase [Bacteroidales bacterium]|nr:pyridoxal phosphate-dependent aminotransferase [Bacteroidales bacterium]
MKNTPIPHAKVKEQIDLLGIRSFGTASIREIKRLVDNIEQATGIKYVRMEMGVPGLAPPQIAVEAEIEALKKGVAAIYPDIDGIKPLKQEISRFIKLFMNIEVKPHGCIPTVGSMQGSFAAFTAVTRMYCEKNTILFLDPGFPVHKQQCKVQGIPFESFDVYEYRGLKLREKLEGLLSKGNIAGLLYSNPNNPSWICFTETELKIIGELAAKYGVVVLEDLAYFGMDFREDYSRPGVPPYQPSVARYTDTYILLISSSKAFSYAGQRIGMMVVSDSLFETMAPDLLRYFSSEKFGHAMVFGTVYALSSGTSHSAQYALAAILKAANDGQFNFLEAVRDYGGKAMVMKKLFTDNGFYIVYDRDEDKPLADGFYFTIAYPGFDGAQLIERLIYYGISAISLTITGSMRNEGLRACVSLVSRDQFPDLEARLKRFREDHPEGGK